MDVPGEEVHVLDNITLRLAAGDFVTVFGPNGCGKSTLLNILAGILPLDSGRISIGGLQPDQQNVGYVFQDFRGTLFPWKRAIDNVAYALALASVTRSERRKLARDLIERFGMRIPLRNYPYQLSGGQQQMTCIARALINDPVLLLLDEPFSALDYETRFFMQQKIMEIWSEIDTTVLFVSHELDEALYLADEAVFLTRRPARVQRILKVDLPRPRTPKMMESDAFFQLKAEGLRTFREALNAEV